jgi:hypothetical protein
LHENQIKIVKSASDLPERLYELARSWKPHLYVVYSEGGWNIIKNFTIDQTFSTREEVELAGLTYVRKWFDDGKPNL